MDRKNGSETETDTESDNELDNEVAAVAEGAEKQDVDEEPGAQESERLLEEERDIGTQIQAVKDQIATVVDQLLNDTGDREGDKKLETELASLGVELATLEAEKKNADGALVRSLDKSLSLEGAAAHAPDSAEVGAAAGGSKPGTAPTPSNEEPRDDDWFSEPEGDSVGERSPHAEEDTDLMGQSFIASKPSAIDVPGGDFSDG